MRGGLLLFSIALAAGACNALTGVDDLVTGDDTDASVPPPAKPDANAVAGDAMPSDTGNGEDVVDAAGPVDAADADATPPMDSGPVYVTPPGLVADWVFDEGSGSTITDKSGKGHTATAIGGTWSADRHGVNGHAYTLAFGTDHLEINGGSDFDRPADAKISIVGWARFNQAPSHGFVIDVGFGAEGYGIELRTPTRLTYWDGTQHAIEITVPDVVGAWHHFGVVIDGGQARLYFDGNRVSAGAVDATPRTSTKLFVGKDAVDTAYTRGTFSNLRFFQSALTDAQVLAEKNR